MNHLADTIRFLRGAGEQTACIYRGGSPSTAGRPSAELHGAIEAALSGILNVRFVDEAFLSSYEAMYKSRVAILVIPELETVPERSFPNLKGFLARGGALLVSSRDLFMREKGRDYVPPFETRRQHEDEYFRRTAALLGLKPYTAAISPLAAAVDTDFCPGLPARIPVGLSPHGVWCSTGSDLLHPEPPYGHAFPERYPVSRNYPVVRGIDPMGKAVSTAAVFSQNWEGGGRLVAAAFNGEGSVLDPKGALLAPFLQGAVAFSAGKVHIVSVDPGYACYRPGEAVDLEIELKSFHERPVACDLSIQVVGNGKVSFAATETVELQPRASLKVTRRRILEEFESDEYTVFVSLAGDGVMHSKASNGFVVWADGAARGGPRFAVSGTHFTLDDRQSLLTGTNYYESNTGELMWLRPDVHRLCSDLREMSAAGINFLRIHYHHPRWFADYLSALHGSVPSYFTPIPGPLPDERFLRILDAHVLMCQKLGIVYGGDLFTLLPEALGDPRGWFGVHDYAWHPERIAQQEKFLELIVPRYGDVPGIAWDLFNEPHDIDDETFLAWAGRIRGFMRALGDMHPITVGSENPGRYAAEVDFFAEHRNFRSAGDIRINSSKPEMLQEVWLDRPSTPEGEHAQRGDMREALAAAFGSGLRGFAPWQWTNQARLRNDFHAFEGEIWDDRLGCCVRDDGTWKPAGLFYQAFAQLVQGLEIREYHEGRFQTDRGVLQLAHSRDRAPTRGEMVIAHHDGDRLHGGLACGKVVWKGDVLLQADEDCDVWFILPAGNLRGDAGEAWLRTEKGCRILFSLPPRLSARASLRASPHEVRDLWPVQLGVEDGCISVTLEDWYSSFWLHVSF